MTRTEEYQNALNGYRNLDVRINKTLRLIGISAIEKQIPKKPIDRCMFMECPTCNEIEIAGCGYCPSCGQKLDWEEGGTSV